MSADKRRGKGLEIDAAYLALASREWGVAVNRTHTYVLTDRLMALRDRGLVRQERRGTARSRTTSFHVTDAGAACLAGLRQRFGPDFGRVELVRETEHRRTDQSAQRMRRWTSHLNFAAMRRAYAAKRA